MIARDIDGMTSLSRVSHTVEREKFVPPNLLSMPGILKKMLSLHIRLKDFMNTSMTDGFYRAAQVSFAPFPDSDHKPDPEPPPL